MNGTTRRHDQPKLAIRIGAAWLLTFAALGLAGWAGEFVETTFGAGRYARYGLQAFIMSGLVVPGILWLRTRADGLSLAGLGLPGFGKSLRSLGLGIGLVALPLAATIALAHLFGWATVTVSGSDAVWSAALFSIVTVIFFEALPEELAFRGYIYRNLNTRMSRRLAGAVAVALFVLLPIVLVTVTQYLGGELYMNGAYGLTAGYVITMAVFGTFVQYLRILTGTIWTGVGFHFAFVLLNRIIGPSPNDLIQFSDIVAPGAMQVTAIAIVGLLAIGLLAYPWLSGRSIGWRRVQPEAGTA